MLAGLIVIIFIIYAVNASNTINKLREENKKLSKEIKKIRELLDSRENILGDENLNSEEILRNNINKEKSVSSVQSQNNVNEKVKKVLTKEEKEILRQKNEKAERERKNTSILIIGALLIVLAAIVFLGSTWNSISNILKTMVIVLLVGVFLGASKIAKEKFKLEKASNTFFYIAMAYIPICLLSFSLFGLLGSYFSIFGEGRYTYLALSMFFTSGIYYINYKNRKTNGLLYGTILSQVLALILVALIFEKSILLISIVLSIYNILLILLTKKENKIELLNYFYNGIPYIIGVVAIFSFGISSGYMLVLLPIIAINFLLLQIKKENSLLNAYLFNISLYAFGIYFSLIYNINISENLKIIISIVYTCVALLIESVIFTKIKDEKLLKGAMVISLISVALIYFKTLIYKNEIIKPFMVSIIETLLMVLIFIKSKESGKKVLGYLIPISLILSVYDILYVLNTGYHAYIISSLVIFVLGELIRAKEFKILNNGFFIISNISIILTYIICTSLYKKELSNDVIYFVLLELVYLYGFIKNKKYIIFKYLSYITSGIILLTGVNFLEISNDINLLVPAILNVIIIILESKYEDLRDNFSNIFIIALELISYLCLIHLGDMKAVLIALLYSAYLMYDNLEHKKNEYLRSIPLLGFLFVILLGFLDESYKIILMLIATVSLTFVTLYKREVSIDTILSGIYLIFTLDYFNNEYLKEIFFLIWSFANMYFMNNEKSKDVFKGLVYIGVFLLYETLILEFTLNEYASFETIGILILAIALLKTIANKYIKNLDNFEYIIYILIYLVALCSYIDEKDGMIFVLFVVGVLFFSYVKKYGVLFIVSLLGILVNAILLTRAFWFAVPWWIYLLLVGGILIGFAIKNESDEKKEKLNVGNVIKNLKDKIEK